MHVAVDIGNTNIVIAIFDRDEPIASFRVFTDEKRTGDEYFVTINSLIEGSGIPKESVKRAIIASVVPNLTRSMEKILRRLFGIAPVIVGHDSKTGLKSESIPSELGSDLLCNLAEAHAKRPNDAVMVVDFGTALTLSVVNEKGEIVGCSIAPGLITAVNSLFGNTAQLPQVELKIPDNAMGRSSRDSIRSGIMFGYAGMVSSMIERTEREIGRKLYVIATGGLSTTISPLVDRFDEIDPIHTLKGLSLILKLSCEN